MMMSTPADRVQRADGANCFSLHHEGVQAPDASWITHSKTSTYGIRLWGVMGRWVRVSGRRKKEDLIK